MATAMEILSSPIINIPALPYKSPARSNSPSPFKVLYLTNRKLDRELTSATPNLYRLVLCANTYDKTLQYQANISKANSAKGTASKTKSKQPHDKLASKSPLAYTASTTPLAGSHVLVTNPASTVEVLEVPAELEDSELDFFDLTRTNHAEPTFTVTEDLFDDWDSESDVSTVDSSESEVSSDESEGETEEDDALGPVS